MSLYFRAHVPSDPSQPHSPSLPSWNAQAFSQLDLFFFFSSPGPQLPSALLFSFLGLCHAYVLVTLTDICCLPSRGPSPASFPRLHHGVEWWGGAGMEFEVKTIWF